VTKVYILACSRHVHPVCHSTGNSGASNLRPIGHTGHLWTRTYSMDEADWIYVDLDYLDCNQEYQKLRTGGMFEQYKHKMVVYAMHDTPSFAYQDPEVLKFISQPLYGREENKRWNIVSMPLQMRHFEYSLILDQEYIESARNTEKKYDFCFIGQTGYQGRNFLEPENIDLPNGSTYLFENTQPIWSVKDVEERVKLSKEFCSKIASARYCFAPRGVGSSSFRLYQSLMVGTVPIIYGMKDRPFEDVLDWSDFSIDGDYCSLTGSLELPSEKDYECMRERGMTIWDQYFHMQKTDEYLFQKYLETKE